MPKLVSKIFNKYYKIIESYPTITAMMIFVLMTAMMMFFYSPLCPGGDFYVHYNRLQVLVNALIEGNFPVYMDYKSIEGYGYIIKLFYSDLLLIPFAMVAIFTSTTTAYLTLIFTTTLLCALFSYITLKRITNNKYISLIISILYTLCTYRIFDMYIRGALGEVLSFTFLPLVVLGVYEIVKGNYNKWYILTIAMVLLVYSHLISTLIISIMLSIYLIANLKILCAERKRIYSLMLAVVLCIPLTAYYIFPMLEQMLSNSFYYQTNKLVEGVIGYRLNEMIAGLFNSVSLRNETLFPKLGAVLTFVVLLRIFIYKQSKNLKFADICALFGTLIFIMTLPQFPWKIPPFAWLSVIQFPWRLLEYTSFLYAVAGGIYLSSLLISKYQKILGVVVLLVLHGLIFNSDSIHYRTFICQNGNPTISYNTSFRGMIGAEYLPSKVPSNNFEYDIPEVYNNFLYHRGQIVDKQKETTQITELIKDKGNVSFVVTLENEDTLELPLTYYIGYQARINNKKIDYTQSENGLIEVNVKENGKFEIAYVGTNLQKISFYITLISIFLFVIYIFYDRNKKTKLSEI